LFLFCRRGSIIFAASENHDDIESTMLPASQRFRRFVVPTLLLLPLVAVFSKLLLTSVQETTKFRNPIDERGWPWVFSQSIANGTTTAQFSFSWPLLLADIAVLLTALSALAVFLAWRGRRNFGWFRFTLRGIMAITALVAVCCGWWMQHANRWKIEQQVLEQLDKKIAILDRKDFEPAWLRRLWRHDDVPMFHSVTWIRVGNDPQQIDDESLKQICRLQHLHVLELYDCPVTNVGISQLACCRELERLDLSSTKVTDAGVAELIKLTNLTRLNLSGTAITDAAIETIVRLTALEDVDISDCRSVTDHGVRRLLELPHLATALIPPWPQVSQDTRGLLKKLLYSRLVSD
jgi:hypothetical protein